MRKIFIVIVIISTNTQLPIPIDIDTYIEVNVWACRDAFPFKLWKKKRKTHFLCLMGWRVKMCVCVCLNWFRLKVHKIFIYFYDVEPEMPCNNNTRRSLFGGDHQATAQRSSSCHKNGLVVIVFRNTKMLYNSRRVLFKERVLNR